MTAAGILFRSLEGDSDLPGMHRVSIASAIADGMDMVEDFETFSQGYSSFMESLPSRNVLIVEFDGAIIGHARVWWKDVTGGARIYSHMSAIMPDFDGGNTRRSMIEWCESRLREIASVHPPEIEKVFEIMCVQDSKLDVLASSMEYEPARFFFEMLRPLVDVQEIAPPSGIAISSAGEDRVLEAWRMTRTAFSDHWSYAAENWSDERLEEKMRSPVFDPTMWFVATSGSQIVGSVQNYIKPEENKLLSRRRGYISNVCVLQSWRERGIAQALVSTSMRELATRGMTEARLGVDSESQTGALALYENLGFAMSKKYVCNRKRLKFNT
jgi:ribosomal protein S18 acetylase RimI-like enzyme